MKIGDIFLTNGFESRSQVGPRPSVRAKWKAKPGFSFVLLNLGTVEHEDKMGEQAERVLNALGWFPLPDVIGLDEGLEAAFAKGATP